MARHYPDQGNASDWWKVASTNQKRYPDLGSERHEYGISTLVPQMSFRGETSSGVGCFSSKISLRLARILHHFFLEVDGN